MEFLTHACFITEIINAIHHINKNDVSFNPQTQDEISPLILICQNPISFPFCCQYHYNIAMAYDIGLWEDLQVTKNCKWQIHYCEISRPFSAALLSIYLSIYMYIFRQAFTFHFTTNTIIPYYSETYPDLNLYLFILVSAGMWFATPVQHTPPNRTILVSNPECYSLHNSTSK